MPPTAHQARQWMLCLILVVLCSYTVVGQSWCKTGLRQSPLNFAEVPVDLSLRPISAQWEDVENFTLSILSKQYVATSFNEYAPTTVDPQTDAEYIMKSIRVLAPSEHTFGGAYRDVEVQVMHEALPAKVTTARRFSLESAVQPRLFVSFTMNAATQWTANSAMDSLMGTGTLRNGSATRRLRLSELVPVSRSYYRYWGSATQEPCAEDVTWVVYSEPLAISTVQLLALRTALGLSVSTASDAPNAAVTRRIVNSVAWRKQQVTALGKTTSDASLASTNVIKERGVVRFVDFVGDEALLKFPKANSFNTHARSWAVASLAVACGTIVLSLIAVIMSRM